MASRTIRFENGFNGELLLERAPLELVRGLGIAMKSEAKRS